jgi:CheY-like chemotaxis protein
MSAISILLVEDDPDDIELMQEALKDNNIEFNLHSISQGDGVLPHLQLSKNFPEIIVLDLNLPKMHGRDVLQRLKESDLFKDIPVVILTTSSSLKEKEFCLNAGASSFISKPSTVDGFNNTIAEIIGIAKSVTHE